MSAAFITLIAIILFSFLFQLSKVTWNNINDFIPPLFKHNNILYYGYSKDPRDYLLSIQYIHSSNHQQCYNLVRSVIPHPGQLYHSREVVCTMGWYVYKVLISVYNYIHSTSHLCTIALLWFTWIVHSRYTFKPRGRIPASYDIVLIFGNNNIIIL